VKKSVKAETVRLATEEEFAGIFPDCEIGAMPPLGELYGVDVYAARELAEDDEIAFNGGSHTELIKLTYAEFKRLVHPRIANVCVEA
jgi:Ala-tRNA(Pro) deacylase